MVQGSVVVLRRRGYYFPRIQSHPDMDRDLNYSGSIPTATTLIPDPLESASILHRTFPIASGSGISSDCSLHEDGIMRCDVQHNQKLSQLNISESFS